MGQKSEEKPQTSFEDVTEVVSTTGEPSPPEFPVVGIGASAGGLEALQEMFGPMPTDAGIGFVIVTHQHPTHTSLLPDLLAKSTQMPVVETKEGVAVEPNHVYVVQPGGYLAISNGVLHRMETGVKEAPRLPIDYFFRSLAEDRKEKAICIVLSGTGTDGTMGLRAIKAESGMAMVEEPRSAKYAGMPSSAIATGLVDYVLPPAEMPSQLLAYVRGPYIQEGSPVAERLAFPEEPLQKIFMLLRAHTGNDFSAYKSSTLRRRIERRMNVHQIQEPNVYVRYLQENPREIDVLFKELLISVTNFFRDPEAWETLIAGPLFELLESRPEGYTFRAWVPGCATGEEAFNLAIAIRECQDRLERHCDVQIFGTDLDDRAIEVARGGQYPDGIAVDVSLQRLERYFIRQDGSYRIRKDIREMVVFAPQNLIKDPPFTKLDVLSCRNLLIYLNGDIQKRLLPIFHYALRPKGLLFLGPSETIGSVTDLFHTLDKRWKIFSRKEVSSSHPMPEIPALPTGEEKPTFAGISATRARTAHVPTLIERMLLGRFAPASIVVNKDGEVVYVHGRTGDYLELAQGQHPRNNVLEMAREGLQIELAAALRQASGQNTEVVRNNIRVKTNGEFAPVLLQVVKLQNPEPLRGLLLITFEPVSPPSGNVETESIEGGEGETEMDRVALLERELLHAKESLKTTVEELETSNEELKSTNEELQSTNEELQSTNEELETSKEEMQSLNEELTTVNTELQSKVEELSQANDDMQNLLNSTDIATIFLDNELCIKRFTEQASQLITLRPSDVGRPISELASHLTHEGLLRDCQEVLKTLVYKETEVQTKEGTWYLMRIMPYRTAENVIKGLVLTFVNINQLKVAEKLGREDRAYFESIVNTVREPLLVLDSQMRIVSANRSFYSTFQMREKQIYGEPLHEIGGGQWDLPPLRERLDEIVSTSTSFEDFEIEADFARVGHKVLQLNGRRLVREAGLPELILLAIEDTTDKQ